MGGVGEGPTGGGACRKAAPRALPMVTSARAPRRAPGGAQLAPRGDGLEHNPVASPRAALQSRKHYPHMPQPTAATTVPDKQIDRTEWTSHPLADIVPIMDERSGGPRSHIQPHRHAPGSCAPYGGGRAMSDEHDSQICERENLIAISAAEEIFDPLKALAEKTAVDPGAPFMPRCWSGSPR